MGGMGSEDEVEILLKICSRLTFLTVNSFWKVLGIRVFREDWREDYLHRVQGKFPLFRG